ncbi:hypothetical protein Kpol_534p2 [Vanderwaltozyma polyspora DSM 70294]|uniref:Prenyltransferase alpha-alpha toroid domain-containing protein n=1 Tax=Vanderwaltozyma polyspora (strain ATCC 22028 / DSM 70294 / BCRC 21397 / CBS 2163 / NBRC 10782 / NRRL Y-8283 / UCD 57-17) TaxID=436907 RepID=A7TJI0_VANPO|nr:uncharacterized protein Kpol_534p2 [Vanderwaltozyma polyspora DSM 70294]EDO17523.1 hypothetical protein Kpol_534p2 [Vanderwaltozyma polyspora DSM 70294]
MDSKLKKEKHWKFLKRHLNLLPSSHQKQDPNRLALVFYSILGLSALEYDKIDGYKVHLPWIRRRYQKMKIPESKEYISGFVGSPLVDIPGLNTFSLSNTLFGLIVLITLKDYDFFTTILDHDSISRFVSSCQTINGSFKSSLDPVTGLPSPVDSDDLRFCYIAVAILYLTGCRTMDDFEKFIDVKNLLKYIKEQECTVGGYGKFDEPHSGYTSCALATLSLLNCTEFITNEFKEKTLCWLLQRQVSNEGCMILQDDKNATYDETDNGGFQGRENKFADTCYCFWCLNSLSILTPDWKGLCDTDLVNSYLLDQTQNTIIGGFSKTDEDDPDIYHTYLGIAALKLIDGTLDGPLCMPISSLQEFLNNSG